MQLTSRVALMNWLAGQGLTGLPEPELLRGFCERCRAEGLELSRGLVVIDTLHPIYEGRGFLWSDRASNEREVFEYGSTPALAPLGVLPHARARSRRDGDRSRRCALDGFLPDRRARRKRPQALSRLRA